MVHKTDPGIDDSVTGSVRPSHLLRGVPVVTVLTGGPLLSQPRLHAVGAMDAGCAPNVLSTELARRVDDEVAICFGTAWLTPASPRRCPSVGCLTVATWW